MALYTVLALAAGFALNGGQEPGVDTQIVAPVMNDGVTHTSPIPVYQAAPQATSTADTRNRVTIQFNDAKPGEVLNALRGLGVDFIVSAGDIPDNARITLNVKDQPVADVLNAVARALGGHWERENNIRVFKKGANVYSAFPSNGVAREFPSAPSFKAMPPLPAMPAFPQFKGDGKMDKAELEKAFGPEYQKRMEAWGKEFEKSFGPEYQKKMEAWAKDMEKRYSSGDFREFRIDSDRQKLDAAELEKLRKSGVELRIQGDRLRADGEKLRLEGDKLRKEVQLRVKTSRDGQNDVFVWGGPGAKGETVRSFAFSSNLDVEKFIKDLTTNQKDMQRKRGYIRYSDLTAEQKKLLGDRPEGKFEITFKVNGDQITIRND